MWLLATIVLLTGCTKGPMTGQSAPPSAGPATQPKDPAAVYATMRPTLQYDAEDLVAARQIEFIAIRGLNQNSGYVLLNRPLWGDQNAQEIAHVLALLRKHGAREAGCALTNSQLMVRPTYGADRCYDLSEATGGQDLRGLLPPVAAVTAEPSTAVLGQTITVRGESWVGGANTVTLELRDADGKLIHLGEAPLEHGTFTWTGPLPARGVSIPPWQHVNLLATVAGVGTANGDLSLTAKR